MLRGFNEKGEKALGSITLPLQFGDLRTEAKFHIIDSDTSYNALIGRPWIHEYRMIPSTLHQCMKYQRDGVEYCIQGDTQPFAVYEIGLYEDAEHYLPRQQGEDGPRKPQVQLPKVAPEFRLPTSVPPTPYRGGRMGRRGRGRVL